MTATTTLLSLFCDRCGKPFLTPRLALECQACVYAVYPFRVVLGYARPTPLITPMAAS